MAIAKQIDFLLAGYRHPTTDAELSGGKVKTYLDGTSTLSSLWTDSAKSGSADNPVILDAYGKAEVFGDNVYKFLIYDSDDVLIETLNGLEYKVKSVAVAEPLVKYFDTVADMVADTDIAVGDVVETLGYYLMGDGGGNTYNIVAAGTGTEDGGEYIDLATHQAYGIFYGGIVSVLQYGAIKDASGDTVAHIQAAHDAFPLVFAPEGTYRMDSYLTVNSDHEIFGVRGATQFWQYGTYLFKHADTGLQNFHMHDLSFYQKSGSASKYDCVFSFGAYRNCVLETLQFSGYNSNTIMERSPIAGATWNGVDNVHRDWDITGCSHVDIAIGLESYYYMHQGDGSTVIDTGVVWPETFNSSVIVLKENGNRVFSQLDLTTDYTVAYDGLSVLTVTLIAAATSSERIHIWPSQPLTTGGTYTRRPYSNNLWENIRCQYVFIAGHTAVRWVDAEVYRFERLILNGDSVVAYRTNPYNDRNGQGGDFLRFDSPVIGYQQTVATPSSLRGFKFGPGSENQIGTGIMMDSLWVHSGNNRSIEMVNDGSRYVNATGTVATTIGSLIVTGTNTVFRDEFTLVGDTNDAIEIDGTLYGITSIDSDTQITLSTTASANTSGVAIRRFNLSSQSSYDMQFSGNGGKRLSVSSKTVSRYVFNSTSEQHGTAVVASGATYVDVTHDAARTPLLGEVMLTPHAGLAAKSYQVTITSATVFRITLSAAASADYSFGWAIKLYKLN